MPLTEKKKASNARWDEKNLARMSLAIPIDLRDRMKIYVASTGETVNGFIRRLIEEKLDKHQ